MLLAIDVGNTNVVIGVYQGQELLASWRAASRAQRTVDEYAVLIEEFLTQRGMHLSQVRGCCVGSVVPKLTTIFAAFAQKYLRDQAVVVGAPGVKTGMVIRTDSPRLVGADRIADAVAARQLYGTPAIVVDFGTATTFDVVSQEGEFLGGAIAPGLGISARALYDYTAKLPQIDLVMPERVIGQNTVASMHSGVVYGYVGLVERVIAGIQEELDGKARVIATGGLASLIAPQAKSIELVNPNLTLEGLRIIYGLNRAA